MEAASSSLAHIYKTIRRHIPKDSRNHHRIIVIVIRHQLDLDRPASASSNSFFKCLPSRLRPTGLQFSFFLPSCCCSFLLHVVVNLICIFLVSRQLVLLSTLPKCRQSFCGPKGCKVKVKVTVERPRRPREGVEIQLYSPFNVGARWGWVVNATPRSLYPR
jgi:hypothetical protein